jgi:hypothetical protein
MWTVASIRQVLGLQKQKQKKTSIAFIGLYFPLAIKNLMSELGCVVQTKGLKVQGKKGGDSSYRHLLITAEMVIVWVLWISSVHYQSQAWWCVPLSHATQDAEAEG